MEIKLRAEQAADYRETEFVTREAFWNHYSPGCNEHYLLHVMRDNPNFVKELDCVAVCDGKIVGNVVYLKSSIMADDGNEYEVLSLGPISVLPAYQRKGIARMLIEHTRALATRMGFRAILLCGDPDFYVRVGFQPAEDFGIRTADNLYFKALQVCGLYETALNGIRGRYVEDGIYYRMNPADVAEFDKEFPSKPLVSGTPSQKRFEEVAAMQRPFEETGSQQCPAIKTLSTSELTIKVSPHGAELCSICCNGKEYLWQADPAYWKRHSPVLFPIVGSVWENAYRHEGETYALTQHGFARDMEFELVAEGDHDLLFRLTDNEETRKKYPFPFCLEIGYRIEGKKIEVVWTVRNTGNREMHFQIGAHPAFYFPGYDAETTERGYFGFGETKDLRYILISEKGCADPDKEYPLALADGLLPLDVHTFDKDALILEGGQVEQVVLYNKEKKPVLSLSSDAPVMGLWSPPMKNAPFVCIEPWFGRCDRAHYTGEYKDKDWMQHLAPGEEFRGGYVIQVWE